MARKVSSRVPVVVLIFTGIFMATTGAAPPPPHPPSSPAITAAISPHPHHNHNQKHQQHERFYHQQEEQPEPQYGISNHKGNRHMNERTNNFLDNNEDNEDVFGSSDIMNSDAYNSGEAAQQSSSDHDTDRMMEELSAEILNPEKNGKNNKEVDDSMELGNSEDKDRDNGDVDDDDLGPALKVLARRKRTPKQGHENKPYTTSRGHPPSSSRYRYPIHRKRTSRVPPSHDYSQNSDDDADENLLFNLYDDYPEPDIPHGAIRLGPRRSSLFRERSTRPSKERFMEEALPSEFLHGSPQVDEKSYYNTLGEPQMYDSGKPGETFISPESFELLENTLESIQRNKLEYEAREEQIKLGEAELLKELLDQAAEEYYQDRRPLDYNYEVANGMVRRKRNASISSVNARNMSVNTKTNQTNHIMQIPPQVAVAEYRARLATDRKKRAFVNPIQYDRRRKLDGQELFKRQSQEDIDDFLTREYFKTIARSVGNKKKKRMSYAKFEPDKRSNAVDAFIDNPEMMEYMMEQLEDAEDSVAEEVHEDMRRSDGEAGAAFLLRNAVGRIDALERMREALQQLKLLQEQPASKRSGEHQQTKKHKKSLTGGAGPGLLRSPARQLHRLVPAHAECPVLDRVYSNCENVAELTGDADQLFLPSCVRHELCYMCGSGVGVSGHECDALLSSSLESHCHGTLDCLRAAGETFSLLRDSRRYDTSGTCAHHPCVRSLLESRR